MGCSFATVINERMIGISQDSLRACAKLDYKLLTNGQSTYYRATAKHTHGIAVEILSGRPSVYDFDLIEIGLSALYGFSVKP